MTTATPDTIGDVIGQIIQESARQAAEQPEHLQEIFKAVEDQIGELAEQVKRLPVDALAALNKIINPPDWWSLMVLVLVKLSELDRSHLSVGSMKPVDWSRMLTLTYTQTADVATPGAEIIGAAITAGLAITDPGTIHGFLLKADAEIDSGLLQLGPATLNIKTNGASEWRMAFGGPITPLSKDARMTIELTWDPNISVPTKPSPGAEEPPAQIKLGAFRARVVLSTMDPELYVVTLGLGDENGNPGLLATVDVRSALGALGTIVQIEPIDQSYSPQLTLSQNAGPRFTLGQRSLP